MEQKDIRYSGMTTRPSDYNSQDGDLSISYNLISEDGELKPLLPPEVVFTLPEYQKFFCIHKVDGEDYYIISTITNDLNSYKLIDKTLSLHSRITSSNNTKDVICIGNTLAILNDASLNTVAHIGYALFQKKSYKYLGSNPPAIDLSFGLHGNFEISERFCSFDYEIPEGIVNGGGMHNVASSHDVIVDGDGAVNCHIPSGYDATRIKNMFSDVLMTEANKYIQQRSVDSGKFIFPFIVRCAYRLYDGSHILHSAPILMTPNNYITAYLDNDDATNTSGSKANVYIWSRIAAMTCKLNYSLRTNSFMLLLLPMWADIIKGIDIFISAPIFTYDQNGKVRGWKSYKVKDGRTLDDYNVFTHSKLDNGNDFDINDYSNRNDSSIYYRERKYAQLYVRHHGKNVTSIQSLPYNEGASGSFNCASTIWLLPQVSKSKIKENITGCSLFYKCASINISDIAYDKIKDLDISAETLRTLQQREILQDDYQTHNTISASYGYSYNARLYLADIKQIMFDGYRPESMLPYSLYPSSLTKIYSIYVFINKGGKEIVVKATGFKETSYRPLFLFYPDTDAYKMILAVNDSPVEAAELKLVPHNLLNGSYYYNDFENIPFGSVSLPQPTNDNSVEMPNKIFASEVNNPFFFPLKNRNNIGTTKIISICSVSKALSQGQFGQFPLYAFTLDGVWALEISDNGEISTKQPASRDVINPNSSLLQIDGGIVFATEQGIILLNGSQSVSISDTLSGNNYPFSTLPHINKLMEVFGLQNIDMDVIPFREYIKECNLAYDYANSRIYVFNKNKQYGYIYSLKSNNWSLFSSSWQDVINNYPTSLVIDSERNVMDLSILNRNALVKGLVITRPINLGYPDLLKTITSSIHRATGEPASTQTALYGSVDSVNFHLLTSSKDKLIRSIHGTPYKSFMFVINTSYKNGESLSKTSLTYDIKRKNKLR